MPIRRIVLILVMMLFDVYQVHAFENAGPVRSFTTQWQAVTLPSPDLWKIALANDGFGGVAVGDRETILYTSDAGLSWHKAATPNVKGVLLSFVTFISSTLVIVVGSEGSIWRSSDGGKNWTAAIVPNDCHVRLLGFSFFNQSNGVAVGDNATIIRTEDAGQTWTHVNVPSNLDHAIWSVAFADSNIALAVGDDGTILRSENGGKDWSTTGPKGISTYFRSVVFSDNNNAIVVGKRYANAQFAVAVAPFQGPTPTLLTTEDAGKTWTWLAPPERTDFDLRSAAVSAQGFEMAVGDRLIVWRNEDGSEQGAQVVGGGILTSSDSGRHWALSHTMDFPQLNAAAITGQQTGIAVGGGGWIVITDNGGSKWERARGPEGVDQTIYSIAFYNASVGVAIGQAGTILRTDNGGRTWTIPSIPIDIQPDLVAIVRVGAKAAVAVGKRGTILHTDDGHKWTAATRPPYAGHDLSAVAFADENSGAAVGDSGTALWTVNGGLDWQPAKLPDGIIGLDCLAFSKDSIGLAAGTGWESQVLRSVILRTDDKGRTWQRTRLPSGVASHLLSVSFSDNNAVVAAGERGVILKSSDSGKTWKLARASLKIDAALHAVQMFNSGGGIIVGDNSLILRTTDSGEHWTLAAIPADADSSLDTIAIVSPSWMLIGGSNGLLLRSDDRGATWSKVAGLSAQDKGIRAIAFANESTGMAAGDSAFLARTRDGGKTWQKIAPFSRDDQFREVSFRAMLFGEDPDSGTIVGDRGVLLRSEGINFAPYVKNWGTSVKQHPNGSISLDLEVSADVSQPVKRVEGQYAVIVKGKPVVWNKLPAEISQSKHDGLWHVSWVPSDQGIAEAVQIGHRILVDDGGPPLAYEELPQIAYRTLWHRLFVEHRAAASSIFAGGVIATAYILTTMFIFFWFPVRLALNSGGAADAVSSLGESSPAWARAAIALFRQITFPWLKRRPRVRNAWIKAYIARETSFDKIASELRHDFLEDEEVLDAWVSRRVVKLRSSIERDKVMSSHPIYVPSPVWIGTTETGRIVASPSAGSIRFSFSPDRAVIKLLGTGGSGKTTLACAMSRWLLSNDDATRLLGRLSIPVLISADTTDLVSSITSTLIVMIGEEGELEPDIISALIRKKRVTVFVDALSERSKEMQQHLSTIFGSGSPMSLVVVTSRADFDTGPIEQTRIEMRPIEVRNIATFIFGYLTERNWASTFSLDEQFDITRNLVDMLDRGVKPPITPLLITLYIDAIKASKDDQDRDIPRSVPEIFLKYIERLNPSNSETPNRVEHQVVKEACYKLALLSLGAELVAKPFERNKSEALLAEDGILSPSAVIDRICDNGILLQRSFAGVRMLEFALDPVAEYLFAIAKCRTLGESKRAWESFIRQITTTEGYPGRLDGILTAVLVCYSAYKAPLHLADIHFPWRG
jgi:photosystem II stability/assembly factor-like uncharacterized protein